MTCPSVHLESVQDVLDRASFLWESLKVLDVDIESAQAFCPVVWKNGNSMAVVCTLFSYEKKTRVLVTLDFPTECMYPHAQVKASCEVVYGDYRYLEGNASENVMNAVISSVDTGPGYLVRLCQALEI